MAVEKIINLKVNTGQAEKQLNNLGTAIKDVDKQATNLDATFQEVYGDLQPLTARMGEAEDRLYELAKAGKQNTTEYKELLKTVGEYKRVQQETDKVVDAAAQTMASKLGGSLNAVAGGFSLAQGTMGLFGTESKDVEQAVLKVQSAMAISQGFETIREGAKSISALGAVIFGSVAAKTADTAATEANNASQSKNIIGRGIQIVQTGIQTTLTAGLTAATWLFNAAMAANPIGAIVAVIAILIASGYALINMFKESSAAAKKAELANIALAKEIKNNKKEQDKANETFQEARDHQLGMAKASGKSTEEIRKLTLQLAKQELQQNLTNYQTNRAIALEAKRIAGLEDATDAEKKTAEEAVKLNNESVKLVNESQKQIRKIESENAIERKQEQTDAIKDSKEKQKENTEDAKAKRKELLSSLKDLEKKYAEDIENLGDKTEADKLATEKERALKELDLIKLSDAEKANAKLLIEQDFQLKDEALKKSHAEKLLALTNKLEDDKNALLKKTDQEKLIISQEKAMKQLELDLKNINATEQEIQNAKIKLRETFALQDAELENVKIAKEDAQWLRMQEATLEKSEYEALVRQQKFEAEYIAAKDNAELQFALKNEYLEKEKDIEIANAKTVADAKVSIQLQALDALGGLVGLAKSIGEKNKGLQKAALVAESAIGIAKIIINTQSANSAVRLKYALLPGGAALAATEILLNKVSAGIGIAATLAATAKGLSALGGGGAGGGGAAGGGEGGGSAAAPPSFNIVGQNSNNQLAQTIAGQQQQPVQAYVVSGNVSSAQSLDRNRIDTATFN